MKRYAFKLVIMGDGDTLEEAWEDALECLLQNPGSVDDRPESFFLVEELEE